MLPIVWEPGNLRTRRFKMQACPRKGIRGRSLFQHRNSGRINNSCSDMIETSSSSSNKAATK